MIAVTQRDVKRMLAYSSVAHVGFVLTGLVAANHAGVASTMFYLLAYGISTVGAFAIVGLVRDRTGEAGDLSAWAGLGRRSPVAAAAFAGVAGTSTLFARATIPTVCRARHSKPRRGWRSPRRFKMGSS